MVVSHFGEDNAKFNHQSVDVEHVDFGPSGGASTDVMSCRIDTIDNDDR